MHQMNFCNIYTLR